MPLAPAAPFHSQQQHQQQQQQQQQPKANLFEQFVYSPSQCSHGPNLVGVENFQYQPILQSFQQQSISQAIPQLQTVYGVPPQSLDVSQSSFEIAQNAGPQGLLTSYGPPASGLANSFDSITNTHEENSPSSSYGPPPSGNPADNFAHSSQKSVSSVQIDSTSDFESNVNDSRTNELPGLSSAGLDIISAQKSVPIEIPVQGQLGTYSLQFQAADPLSSQTNEIGTPDHQKLLNDGLLQSILSAIEEPKGNDVAESASQAQSLDAHPEVNEFVKSSVGQETLSEVEAE